MGRKTANYTVADEGRDKGKLFIITEMSASQAEAWALRVLLALINAEVDIPEGFDNLGMAALAQLGLKCITGLKWEVAQPLLDEMMTCVQYVPDPKKIQTVRAIMTDSDIEEVLTRFRLRVEVWQLHMGFLQAVLPSLNGSAAKPAKSASHTVTSPKS